MGQPASTVRSIVRPDHKFYSEGENRPTKTSIKSIPSTDMMWFTGWRWSTLYDPLFEGIAALVAKKKTIHTVAFEYRKFEDLVSHLKAFALMDVFDKIGAPNIILVTDKDPRDAMAADLVLTKLTALPNQVLKYDVMSFMNGYAGTPSLWSWSAMDKRARYLVQPKANSRIRLTITGEFIFGSVFHVLTSPGDSTQDPKSKARNARWQSVKVHFTASSTLKHLRENGQLAS